jgi:hypothetical protein
MIRCIVMPSRRAALLSVLVLAVGAGCAGAAAGTAASAPVNEDVIGKDSLKTNPLPPLVAKADATPTATAKGGPVTPPPAAPGDDPGAKYAAFINTINTNIPGWKTGAAAALMLFNSERNEQRPLLVDNHEQAAVPKGDHYSFYMDMESDDAWFVLLIPQFVAGHYECNKDPIISVAASFTKDFTGDDPKAMWSLNEGGNCKVDISPGKLPGDYIARINGILVANDGNSLLRIQSAYVYFRNMPSGPPPKTAAPVPTSAKAGPVQKGGPAAAGTTPKVRLPR